jgi:hypothetical protein
MLARYAKVASAWGRRTLCILDSRLIFEIVSRYSSKRPGKICFASKMLA